MKNKHSNMETFGSNLKKFLSEKGIAQKELAEHLGVSSTSVSEWISGKKRPRLKNIYETAKWLNVNTSDLVDLDGKYIECHSLMYELFADDKRVLSALNSVSGDGKINIDGHWCELSAGAMALAKSVLLKVVNDSLLEWQLKQQVQADMAGMMDIFTPGNKEGHE